MLAKPCQILVMCFGVAKDLHAIQNIWHQHAADFVAGGVCREMGDMRVATEKAETFLHHERGMCTALGDALRSAFTDCLQLHTLSAHHWQLHTASLAFVVLAQLCGLITVFFMQNKMVQMGISCSLCLHCMHTTYHKHIHGQRDRLPACRPSGDNCTYMSICVYTLFMCYNIYVYLQHMCTCMYVYTTA